MFRGRERKTIFEEMQGPHEKRFVAFNDISAANSKYRRDTFFNMDGRQGRELPLVDDPEPVEENPDYFPNKAYVEPSLKKGYVTFNSKQGREKV